MNLFQKGQFTLSSGGKSDFRIDCDALTDDDIAAIAQEIAKRVKFRSVFGVPSGGERLEKALTPYADKQADSSAPVLIVDDVFTTGKSMVAHLEYLLEARVAKLSEFTGFVIFARNNPAPLQWINALFKMY